MEERHGEAGDANHNESIATPLNEAPDTPANGVADDANVTALDDGIKYTLTAAQALARIAEARRKVPSLRSLQRHCVDKALRATKIKTTYGQEWLINEASLASYIAQQPHLETGDAGDAASTSTPALSKNVDRDTTANGDPGDAMALPVGERRTLAEVLIENAKLLAHSEDKDVLIAELRDDRGFLREEVREARKLRGDVKEIAHEMLGTLKAMALGKALATPRSPEPTEIITPTGETRHI